MVEEEELHDPLLRLAGDLGGVLGVDVHAVRQHLRAGRLRLRHPVDLDQAGAARGDRIQQRVVAEARHLDAELLSGADREGALGHAHLDAVDDDSIGTGAAHARAHRIQKIREIDDFRFARRVFHGMREFVLQFFGALFDRSSWPAAFALATAIS